MNDTGKIKGEDVCKLLKLKFGVEKMEKFFSINTDYSYAINDLHLSKENSIFIKFNGIKKAATYNMLLIFCMNNEQNYDYKRQHEIREISEGNIDKIVIWSLHPIKPEIVQQLKHSKTSIIYISQEDIAKIEHISNFFRFGGDYDYAVILNKLTDLLLVRLKKLFHFVLSEIAAPSYDDNYGKEKVGTEETMKFEEEIIQDVIKKIKDNNHAINETLYAVDVGCGTGRHTIEILSEHFEKIYGFDFSDKMIKAAKAKKRRAELDHVQFTVADMEYEEVLHEKILKAKQT